MRKIQSQAEGGALRIDIGAVAGQHAVTAQQFEQFTGQSRLELGHGAIVHHHPFGMGAGHTENMPPLG